mgnify:CR=1 FL=1
MVQTGESVLAYTWLCRATCPSALYSVSWYSVGALPPAGSNPCVCTRISNVEPNGTTSLAVTGPCVGSQARVLATDTGEYRFNPAELETRTTKGPCTVAAKIVRTSGSATQTATTTFEVTP